MREVKAILYPLGGLFQFVIAVQQGFPAAILFSILGVALIGLGILNLRKAIWEAK
jgi:hypothetical protein